MTTRSAQARQLQNHFLVISPNFIRYGFGLADSISLLNCGTFHLGICMSIDHRCFNLRVTKILSEEHHGHSGLV